jgi:hypothetical protein
MAMFDNVTQHNIDEGRKWCELEMQAYAIERDVRLRSVIWTDSPQSQAFILEITSGAGEHTLSLPWETLQKCASGAHTQMLLRERLRGLIGDLARIEKRGHLR